MNACDRITNPYIWGIGLQIPMNVVPMNENVCAQSVETQYIASQ